MNGINPWRQTYWDWRAAANFIAGGSGTGLLLIAAIAGSGDNPVVALTLLSLALVVAGLGTVWLELGRPWRFLHVFFNPHTSWMTRESIVAMALLPAGLAAAFTDWLSLLWIAALIGAGFLYCQGRILIAAKGIPVWRTPRIMWLILSTGAVEGASLFLLGAPWLAPGASAEMTPVVMVLLMLTAWARLGAWWFYLQKLQGNAPKAALAVLNRASPLFIAVGHVLPIVAVGVGLFAPNVRSATAVVAAVCALTMGWFIKFIIITRAAFNQGYAIDHAPARGGGQPGPGIKPGW